MSTTILDLIQTARNETDIQQLINAGNNMRPSGKTKRSWLSAANKRRQELAPVSAQPEPEP